MELNELLQFSEKVQHLLSRYPYGELLTWAKNFAAALADYNMQYAEDLLQQLPQNIPLA